MKRSACRASLLAFLAAVVAFGAATARAEKVNEAGKPKAPGLGDPGRLVSIAVEEPGDFVLRGPEVRRQLIVTGKYSSGQERDLTHHVTYESTPAGIVRIEEGGQVVPLADGKVTITARSSEGVVGTGSLVVDGFGQDIPIDFDNQIVPIFTKNGCNSGGCHGKASGQNGFKLSLLGFYPDDDYEFLVKEAWGRRLFPGAPDRSLILLKASNTMPHGGGRLLKPDDHQYRILRRWIAQGMPRVEPAQAKRVVQIEVFPKARAMERGSKQQVRAIARYSDGSSEDVTRMTQFEPNDPEMAGVSVGGLVTTMDLTGNVAVMARYQANVDVFRASIPLGAKVENLPAPANFIDERVFGKLVALGVPPSPVCDDATFLRRVSIDVAGRIPTAEEAEKFLADTNPAKRDQWIDRLLESTDYADYFANKWSAVLRNQRGPQNFVRGTYAFHEWLRESLHRNAPYDEMVRYILAASGNSSQNPAVGWYRSVSTTIEQVEDTAQLFLGLRIQCARCHHHPFERWSQDDYYGFSAFFSRVGRKNSLDSNQTQNDVRVFHNRGLAQAQHIRTGQMLKPTGLAGEPLEIDPDDDPRHALVDWMAQPDNPFFSRALANRYWKHFFGRGLVDPEDDMRVTNPASNEELLTALARHFVASKFDLKDLVRTICRSKTYQLSSVPDDDNINDKQNFASYYPKRLNAEVLYDAINQVTNVPTSFGLPAGTRAVQLPDNGFNNYFLEVFGKPKGETACECERVSEANLAQSLHLLNSGEIQGKLSNGGGRAVLLARDANRPDEQKLAELYLWVYSRRPQPDELSIAVAYIGKKSDNKQQAYEDILWALINTKEFLFNH